MKVIGFAGFSGAGKTTLITAVIPLLVEAGVRPSLIKHAHHAFDVDRPGKDSHRYREAGAGEVMVGSARRWALMHELREAAEPTLPELIGRLSPCDLVLVEGFKNAPIDKIEVWREGCAQPMLWPRDGNIVAVASDVALQTTLPRLDINDPGQVAGFILRRLR
ncbi:MAG: molybdopterin-guanine dinucleotide biosynthesis protein B [Burkholderiaceae bacterium]